MKNAILLIILIIAIPTGLYAFVDILFSVFFIVQSGAFTPAAMGAVSGKLLALLLAVLAGLLSRYYRQTR